MYYLIEQNEDQQINITEFSDRNRLVGHLSSKDYDRKKPINHVGYIDQDSIMVIKGSCVTLAKRNIFDIVE